MIPSLLHLLLANCPILSSSRVVPPLDSRSMHRALIESRRRTRTLQGLSQVASVTPSSKGSARLSFTAYKSKLQGPLSKDHASLTVAADRAADVLMTSSAFSALFRTSEFVTLMERQFRDGWCIPISVIAHEGPPYAASPNFLGRRLVVFDKPLIAKKVTARQKNCSFYKVATVVDVA